MFWEGGKDEPAGNWGGLILLSMMMAMTALSLPYMEQSVRISLSVSPLSKQGMILNNYNYISRMAVSPDGKRIAVIDSAYSDSLHLWDVQQRTKTEALARITGIQMLFSRDGKYLLCETIQNKERRMSILDVATGQQVKLFKEAFPQGSVESLLRMVFSANGKFLGTGMQRERRLDIWDITTGELIKSYNTDYLGIIGLSDDIRYAVIDYAKKGALIDLEKDQVIHTFYDDSMNIELFRYVTAVTPDLARMALIHNKPGEKRGEYNPVLEIWDVFAGKKIRTVDYGKEEEQILIAISPDGRYVASTHETKGKILLVDLADANEASVQIVTHAAPSISSIEFSADSQQLIMAGANYIKLIQLE
jgi:WD40 repeat protein